VGIPPLPLLHVVQTATRVSTVDPRLVVLALLILTAVIICTWMPRPMTLQRLTRTPAMRVTMAALVFFAVLPSVVPYDHLLPGVHHDTSVAGEAVHETHCHLTPGSCADAPVTAGPGQLIFNDPLVIAPALMAVLLAFALPVLTGMTYKPDTRPPLG
jgi:hypothetical protein